MKFASLCDYPMSDFAKEARKIPASLEHLFGRSIYCDMINPIRSPENMVFSLRPAKQTEVARLLTGCLLGEEGRIVEALAKIIKDSFPAQISNFRFVADSRNPCLVYLENCVGEKSAFRPLQYFAAKSRLTFWKRCWNLGNFNYHGSNAMIDPFVKFCLSPCKN